MQIPSIVAAIHWIFEPLGDVVTLEIDTSDLAYVARPWCLLWMTETTVNPGIFRSISDVVCVSWRSRTVAEFSRASCWITSLFACAIPSTFS